VAAFITHTATDITINTTSLADVNLYTVWVTALPEPSAFLVLTAPATVSFSLKV
jgi:hypothetical protein